MCVFFLKIQAIQKSCVLAWPLDGTAVRKIIANHQPDSAEKMS